MIYLTRVRQVILESLLQEDKTVREIAGSKQHLTVIASGCCKMRKLSLISVIKTGANGIKVYRITEAGRALLRGEYHDPRFPRIGT